MPADRIASLLASATEIVALLGLEDRLVAISHECDYPPALLNRPLASRPVFDVEGRESGEIDRAVKAALLEHGSVYAVDADLLARVEPSLILTQAVCDVCAVPTAGVREVVADRHLDAEVLSLDAHTVADILDTIHAVGNAAGVSDRADITVHELRRRIAHVETLVHDLERPRVLALEWLDPIFLPGHWVPEMIEIAGGTNLAGHAGTRSAESTFDALDGLDPDVLIIMPCGYDLATSVREAARFDTSLIQLAPRAFRNGNAWAVDGSSYFNRSGPRVVDGIEILAGILHPELRNLVRDHAARRITIT
jgi:iron complex transport system substrate-binding protein